MSETNDGDVVSILGCGWLGMPLAKRLIAGRFRVLGSTTTRAKIARLADAGITPYYLKITERGIEGDIVQFLEEAEILLVDIPPGLRKNPQLDFTRKMVRLTNAIEGSAIKNVLLISSTSVFADTSNFPTYCEFDLPNGDTPAARQLIAVENLFSGNARFATTILRFGGLCGDGRLPLKFMSTPQGMRNPKAPINLIHQHDCIALIEAIIAQRAWGNVFHGVYPAHPQKQVFYAALSNSTAAAVDDFVAMDDSVGKIVSSSNTQEALHFQFGNAP